MGLQHQLMNPSHAYVRRLYYKYHLFTTLPNLVHEAVDKFSLRTIKMNALEKLLHHLRQILTPELCLAVHRLKFPFGKGGLPNGTIVGHSQFRPTKEYLQAFYDLCFDGAILPMSKLPLDLLLAADLTELLPPPNAPEYPEHCLGLVTLLDQQRIYMHGYGWRYTRAFFDPICENLARALIALPSDLRPDGKVAWLSRGYTVDDWLARAVWFWGPLAHSDAFMTADRQHLKDWLHWMRAEVESYCGYSDPFAPLEAQDDVDLNAFQRIEEEGPPLKSYADESKPATLADYAFWWVRIVNSHFAITDFCGHYPYWIRWTGVDWTAKDKEYMGETNWHRYDLENEPALKQVKEDVKAGVWRLLEPNPEFEKSVKVNGVDNVA